MMTHPLLSIVGSRGIHTELRIRTAENHVIHIFIELTRYGLSADSGFSTLKVRSCGGIPHIGLSEIHPEVETPYYHLVFRTNWDRSGLLEIRQGVHESLFVASTSFPLAVCEEFLPYWIRWSNTTLEVGQGNTFSEESRFLMWTRDINFYIRYISVASFHTEVDFIFLY
jgi:hypothetical protein